MMLAATFNGNPRATIISCYSPTNVSEETEQVAFNNEQSSLVRSRPKHNVLASHWRRYECPNREKTETTNTAYTRRQIGMDNI